MLLKICHSPTAFYIVDDVSDVLFNSHLSTGTEIEFYSDTGKPVATSAVSKVLYCPEYLRDSVGCVPIGNTDTLYCLNTVQFMSGDTPHAIAYTGAAYLCDSAGKTLDVLR